VKGMDRRRKGKIRENFWRENWRVNEESQSMGIYSVNISEITNNNNNKNNNNDNNLPRNFK